MHIGELGFLIKKIKRASFTVEAAFIMPMVLFVLFEILQGGLWLHDEAVLEALVIKRLEWGEMALRYDGDIVTGRPDYEAILQKEEREEKWGAVERDLNEELQEVLFMEKTVNIKIDRYKPLLGEKEIRLLGGEGKRSLFVFDPAEHKRRVSR